MPLTCVVHITLACSTTHYLHLGHSTQPLWQRDVVNLQHTHAQHNNVVDINMACDEDSRGQVSSAVTADAWLLAEASPSGPELVAPEPAWMPGRFVDAKTRTNTLTLQ
jgi:hypothetical protein